MILREALLLPLLLLCLASGFSPRRSPVLRRDTRARAAPWPEFKQVPLPIKLAGGLFLFGGSVGRKDRALADELLALAQRALNEDPAVTAELGYGLETGGVYSSAADGDSAEAERRLVLQFQIQGGNLWAQGTARGIRRDPNAPAELLELSVTNMDGAMMGDGGARVRLEPSSDSLVS
jgi:hypothetical protein